MEGPDQWQCDRPGSRRGAAADSHAFEALADRDDLLAVCRPGEPLAGNVRGTTRVPAGAPALILGFPDAFDLGISDTPHSINSDRTLHYRAMITPRNVVRQGQLSAASSSATWRNSAKRGVGKASQSWVLRFCGSQAMRRANFREAFRGCAGNQTEPPRGPSSEDRSGVYRREMGELQLGSGERKRGSGKGVGNRKVIVLANFSSIDSCHLICPSNEMAYVGFSRMPINCHRANSRSRRWCKAGGSLCRPTAAGSPTAGATSRQRPRSNPEWPEAP